MRRRAAGLAALGVGRGDTVGFMLVNRPAFHLTDTAAMHLGATCFSVYNTSSPEQVEYVVADAANRVIVTEQAFLDDGAGGARAGRDARARGRHRRRGAGGDDLDRGAGGDGRARTSTSRPPGAAVEPEDVLCLIYTSGTTGPPKGVQLTHANMVAVWRACDAGPADRRPAGASISFLPSAHIADRWAQPSTRR